MDKIFIVLMSVSCFFIVLGFIIKKYRCQNYWNKITGKIVNTTPTHVGKSKAMMLTISYIVGGNMYISKCIAKVDIHHRAGETVDIYYNPDCIENIEISDFPSDTALIATLILSAISTIFMLNLL